MHTCIHTYTSRLASKAYGHPETKSGHRSTPIHTYMHTYIHTYIHTYTSRLASTAYGRPKSKSGHRSTPVALPILRRPRRQFARDESSLQAQRSPSVDESGMDLSRSARTTSMILRRGSSVSRKGYGDSDGVDILRLPSTPFTSILEHQGSFSQRNTHQNSGGDFERTQRKGTPGGDTFEGVRAGSVLSMQNLTRTPSGNGMGAQGNERTRSGSVQILSPWQLVVKFQVHTRGLCMCLLSKDDKVKRVCVRVYVYVCVVCVCVCVCAVKFQVCIYVWDIMHAHTYIHRTYINVLL
jgi:hypothetical protein